jgi:hypothetical protein
LDLDAANAFWSELTGIPLAQFGKPYRAIPDPSIRSTKHPMGCPGVLYRRLVQLQPHSSRSDGLGDGAAILRQFVPG